jgi:hypothetical protein
MKPILRNAGLILLLYSFAASPVALSQPVGYFTGAKPTCGAVNTDIQDSNGSISTDELTLFFSRASDGIEDIYEATRSEIDGCFDVVTRLEGEVNGPFEDIVTHTRIAPDGATVIFFNSNRPGGFGQHDMYMATRPVGAQDFGNVINLGDGVNGPLDDRCPILTPDGREMIFYSDRDGGFGSYDLYRATRTDLSEDFGRVEHLGEPVNTVHHERGCVLSSDGLNLFFFSDRADPGIFGPDMWVATRTTREAPFESAVNLDEFSLGSSLNLPETIEFPSSISRNWPANGSKLYFMVIRSSAQGDWEIHEATWISFDDCVIQEGAEEADCDENGLADDCEVARGASHLDIDSDQDGTLDVCQVLDFRSEEVAPWQPEDIGEPEVAGGAHFEGDCLRVLAGPGAVRARNNDSFSLLQQPVAGDFQFTARLGEWIQAGPGSLAGLMVRESLEANSRHSGVALEKRESDFRHSFMRRERVFTRSQDHGVYDNLGLWLRLERRGDVISGELSVDGKTWTEPDGVELVDLPEEIHVGLALLAAGDDPTVATFCDLSLLPLAEPATKFLRGDCNQSAQVDISDGQCILDWRFSGAAAPGCLAATNTNGDGRTDIADAIYLFGALFLGGPPPAAPFPECGVGTEADAALGCVTPPASCR